jgi:hypothetical protein
MHKCCSYVFIWLFLLAYKCRTWQYCILASCCINILFISYNIFPFPMQLITSPTSSHSMFWLSSGVYYFAKIVALHGMSKQQQQQHIHRQINKLTTQAGWRTYSQWGIHGENDNYTNTLTNCTVTHVRPMPQEMLRKWIQTRRPQTTSFGRVDDDPNNNIEILINFNRFYWFGLSGVNLF